MRILFVGNIEVIHFPKYEAFAILIYPMISNYNATFIRITIAGSIDEVYHFFHLAPIDTGYFNLNDVLTNLVGGVFGLLLLRSFGIEQKTNNPWCRSSGVYGFAGLCLLVFDLWLSCFMSIYPSQTPTIQMITTEVAGFWHEVPPNLVYMW